MGSMKLVKLAEAPVLPVTFDDYSPARTVQGCRVRSKAGALLIESGGRFKRFPAGSERVCILAGSGHFKWQRGELPFAAGDAFLAEGLEEYDLYGEGVFWIAED